MESNKQLADNKPGIMQKLVFKLLDNIQFGKLMLTDPTGCYEFVGSREIDAYRVKMQVHDTAFYKKIFLRGSLGAAESYMDGDWESEDVTKLLEMMLKNTEVSNNMENINAKFANLLMMIANALNTNNIANAKKNILAHYDLGNDFFKLFLDKTMMYSCALYDKPQISLEEASLRKLDTICEQLELTPNDHVLEIGTGWGGFAIHAARKYGCKITTTTISDKQYAYAKKAIVNAGLQNQIELLNQDYRQLKGRFDKLVSIEMIEAVGHKFFDKFFQQCNSLLKPGGLFFLQAITINDQTYQIAKARIDFIKKYIFPGGCLPSVHTISRCIAEQTNLQLVRMYDIGKHYAVTLLDWLDNFNKNIEPVKKQGFSEEFIRMWQFYFCYCAAGFRQGYIGDIQALWRKNVW